MRLDIHTHTRYSDGANTVEEMVAYAKKIGLDGIAVTDHDTIKGGIRALRYATEDFIVIPGIEVSSLDGHILVLNVTEHIDAQIPASAVVERAHALGGIAIAAHPYDSIRSGVGDLIHKLDFDAVEVINGHTLHASRNTRKAAEKANLPKVGGSDAHSIWELDTVSIIVDSDPIESILSDKIKIVSNINKKKIFYGMVKRRIQRLLSTIY